MARGRSLARGGGGDPRSEVDPFSDGETTGSDSDESPQQGMGARCLGRTSNPHLAKKKPDPDTPRGVAESEPAGRSHRGPRGLPPPLRLGVRRGLPRRRRHWIRSCDSKIGVCRAHPIFFVLAKSSYQWSAISLLPGPPRAAPSGGHD